MKDCFMAFAACLILVGCGASVDSGNQASNAAQAGESNAGGQAHWDLQRKPLGRIPAGTSFGATPAAGWSHMILFVAGRLASGDVEAASEMVRGYAKMFNLVILANAKRDRSNRYYLEKVGIGFSMNIGGKHTVVTADTQAKLGANLGFIGGSVLSGNEAALGDVQQVVRYSSSILFDAPTMMLYNGDHREMIVRYLIWVSPVNGRVGTVVWLMDEGTSDQQYVLVEKTFQFLPPNMREDRIMNVKGDRFTFGIPAKDAFALVRIPQGKAYEFTAEMRRYAGGVNYTKASYTALLSSMAAAMTEAGATSR